MQLYLMRHAEAEKIGGAILTDSERTLTAYGRSQAYAIARELKRRNVRPFILSSPFRRTLETAEILSETLGADAVRQEPLLASMGRAPDLAALLKGHPNVQDLLLLGHQPDIGMLAGQLLGFEFGFSPATVTAFESQPASRWKFLWTVTPENL